MFGSLCTEDLRSVPTTHAVRSDTLHSSRLMHGAYREALRCGCSVSETRHATTMHFFSPLNVTRLKLGILLHFSTIGIYVEEDLLHDFFFLGCVLLWLSLTWFGCYSTDLHQRSYFDEH